MSETISVTVAQKFRASAPSVYEAWLSPEKVREWQSIALRNMGLSGEIARIEIDPKVGGTFLFSDMRNGIEKIHWGTYLELDYPRRLAFSWNTVESDESDPVEITLTFEPDGEGCVATLANQMDLKWADYREATAKGWRSILQAIDQSLDG